MDYMIATFRSRNATVNIYNYLTRQVGLNCALVSTPRAANVGCGLSIKFHTSDFNYLSAHLPSMETFAGFFRVVNVNGKTVVTRS